MGAAAEGFSLPGDGQTLPAPPGERSLSMPVSRPLVAFEPLRPVQAAAQDLRGIDLVSAQENEQIQVRFSIGDRSEAAGPGDLQRTLRSSAFSSQLDRLRADVQEELQLDKSVTISVAGVSLGLSLVYVLWLVRGGVLMGSYLSAMPAWRVLDPLPVLSRADEEVEEDDEALDAVSDGGGNPLRGFG